MPGITDAPSWQNGQNGGLYHDFRIGVGHHGLFAEALAEPGTPLAFRGNPLRLGHPTVYHNRNRTYDPHLGRFFQHDPNGTGQTLAGLAAQGQLGWTAPSAFSSEAWFGDGGNLYAAYGHDPVNATDTSGLFFSLTGLLSTTAKRAGQAYNAYDTGDQVYGFASAIASGVSLQQAMLGLAIDALFDKAGGKAFDAALSGAQGVSRRFSRGVRSGCNCVPTGTLVATLEGDVPIESLQVGDYVLSVDQFAPDSEPVWAPIEAVIARETQELIRLTLEDGRTLSMTESHLIWVDQVGWIDAGDVAAEDLIRTQSGPAARVLSAERVAVSPTPTYTLQVKGTHTYFAGGVWVHNSCRVIQTRNNGSARAQAYEDQITRMSGNSVEINGVEFDGIDGRMLLDAKGPGYADLISNGRIAEKIADQFQSTARRQLNAADGRPIKWIFAEPEMVEGTRRLFRDRGIRGISIEHIPAID